MDRFDRRVAVAYYKALFRGGLLALAALPVATFALEGGWWPDPLLASSVATISLVSVLAGRLLKRGILRLRGWGMVAAVLVTAAAGILSMQATGGMTSPLLLLLATVVGLAGMTLTPLGGFLAMSGVSLLYTLMAVSEPSGFALGRLVVQLGFLGMFGFAVNLLACRLREQRAELVGLALRDPVSGTLRTSFFRARLVALLEDAEREGAGVDLMLFDLGAVEEEGRLMDAGSVLLGSVRSDDLIGRVGPACFAVAMRTAAPENGPRIAQRLARKLRSVAETTVASVHLAEASDDPVEAARRLLAQAHESLRASSQQLVSCSGSSLTETGD